MVAVAFQRGGQGGGRGRGRGGGAGRGQQHADEVTAAGFHAPQTYEEYRDMPYLAHVDPATGKSSHTNRNCKWVNDLKVDPEAGYKRARKHRPRGKGGKGKNKEKDEDSSEAMDEDDASLDPKEGSAANKPNPFVKKSVGLYHTFLRTPTVHASKSALRILKATFPAVPQYVRWSETPCTFDRSDHPTIIPKECYALVVSPRLDGYDFSKCLMDGEASLNIMYLETLERMQLTKEQLKHSNTEFHGVVSGKKANSLGSIRLPVAFGDVNNFREEMITFEVVPFKSSYHIIFGRTTYHKFHARACYIYNKLKIPGPNGATYQHTVHRCLKDEIGQNVHAYVDDIAVMTRKGSDLISNITETFENLRRTAIKSQILVDFVADWTEAPDAELEPEPETWVMHFDRSKQHQGLGAEVTLKSPTGEELPYVLQIHFEPTNNMAEYDALLHGLRIAKEIGIKHIICCGDSDLVAQQVAGTWNARNSVMTAYRDEVDEIAKCFVRYEVKYVQRDDNTAANMLSKLGSGRKPIPPGIFLEHLRIPSVKGANPENPDVAVSPAKEVMVITPAWTKPFLDYLLDRNKLPEDEVLAR
ncbi:hypothetical protein QYE76_058777 [Lolium multiflorum]|uniref:RNase H type-1 domain-containing protein n=1 Tax=Lolium multiflorum TaxID=4521 RepID=A0AAD8T650_LOLMU|nr:hypothetical protein QYE76_058777 [Lolium multiflorum]